MSYDQWKDPPLITATTMTATGCLSLKRSKNKRTAMTCFGLVMLGVFAAFGLRWFAEWMTYVNNRD